MGKSITNAKNKYNKNHYDRVSFCTEKGSKDLLKHFAELENKSMSMFIQEALAHHIWRYHYKEMCDYLQKVDGVPADELPPPPAKRLLKPPQRGMFDTVFDLLGF